LLGQKELSMSATARLLINEFSGDKYIKLKSICQLNRDITQFLMNGTFKLMRKPGTLPTFKFISIFLLCLGG